MAQPPADAADADAAMPTKAEPTTTNRRAFIMPLLHHQPRRGSGASSDEGPIAPAHVIRPVETIADRFWFELPGSLDYLRAAFERTQAVRHQLIGFHLVDAQELATRSLCHLRVVRRNGPGSIEALELDCNA